MFTSIGIISSQIIDTTVYSLDALSTSAKNGARGLFSLKRLLKSYSGAVINVRNGNSGLTLMYMEIIMEI